jgi:hypothetical protein
MADPALTTTPPAPTASPTVRAGRRLAVGDVAPPLAATSLAGAAIAPPRPGEVLYLQFRRFAGCPVCNLHLRQVAARVDELRAAGVRVVAVFHSEAATMMPYQGDLPFEVIADPGKALYRAFAVEASWRSILDPRSWWPMLRGMFARHPWSARRGEGGHLGLPAEFLLGADGVVRAAHYGRHAADHWSVDRVLALARG